MAADSIKIMLKKFFSKRKQNQTQSSTPALSSAVKQSIFNFLGARGLPTMPGAAQKAFELSINPQAEARDFIEVIQGDEALSARVMKIANSVYFDRGKRSETIEESILVIGLSELRSLLGATTLTDLFPSKHPARRQFWANDIATALTAKILSQKLLPEKTEIAFMAGLMHDIGKLLLLQRAPEQYEKVLEKVKSKGIEFHKAEAEIFVFDHCEVGQLIGQQWNFSEELINSIRCHHRPWTPEDLEKKTTPTLAQIVKVSDQIAHALGLGLDPEYGKLKRNYEALLNPSWHCLAVPEGEQKTLLDLVSSTFTKESDLYLA